MVKIITVVSGILIILGLIAAGAGIFIPSIVTVKYVLVS